MSENDLRDLLGVAGYELYDIWRETGFEENLVEEPVGGHGGRGRFPNNNIAHQCGCTWQVPCDGGKVEWGDCIDEAFKWPIFDAAGIVLVQRTDKMRKHDILPDSRRIVNGLLSVQLLCVLHVESTQDQQVASRASVPTNFRKSTVSAAASISACQAFLPCPSIVAAMISYLYLPPMRSAALRKMAARSTKGVASHDSLAARAASMAALTSDALALEKLATASAWEDGLDCVRTEEFLICHCQIEVNWQCAYGEEDLSTANDSGNLEG